MRDKVFEPWLYSASDRASTLFCDVALIALLLLSPSRFGSDNVDSTLLDPVVR